MGSGKTEIIGEYLGVIEMPETFQQKGLL